MKVKVRKGKRCKRDRRYNKKQIDFDYHPCYRVLARLLQIAIIFVPYCYGFGEHCLETHRGTHHLHRQVSYGFWPNLTINFREFQQVA